MKKIFFSASIYALPDAMDDYQMILDEIKKTKNKLLVDWLLIWKKSYEKQESSVVDSDLFFVNSRKILESDFVVAEITNPTVGVGYQIFYATTNKKPVLALYSDSVGGIESIKKVINVDSPLVFLKKYNKNNIANLLNDFFNKKENLKKFNFITSERIMEYIDWLHENNPEKSRSELLREKIDNNVISKDDNYQKYLKSLVDK